MTERQKLKADEEGMKYLKEIFDRIWLISNPTRLNISGFGEITATSMVLESVSNGKMESYFTFRKANGTGTIIRQDNNYYFVEVGRETK